MASKKPLFMESTEIAPERTAAEIQVELIKDGASQIAMDFEDGKIKGLRWAMKIGPTVALFGMPARVEPVYQILYKRVANNWNVDKDKLRAKAERVAWRQLLRWTQSQVAMIETGMVQPSEVFLSYMLDQTGTQTFFERFVESGYKMLPPGKPQ